VKLQFTKMNGAGNDFILVDNRSGGVHLAPEDVMRLCDRRRGVGADGVLVWVPCRSGRADWAWEFYNSDGSTAAMCGNGARCFARFVQRKGGAGDRVTFETGAGVITATFDGGRVTVGLTPPCEWRLRETVGVKGGECVVHSVNTGVPHAVVFVPDVGAVPVSARGAELRWHPHFGSRGTNVNFVQVLGEGRIRVRTYERGVEGETLACGTGVTASALVCARLHGFGSPVRVVVEGGDELEVAFQEAGGEWTRVSLCGPAEFVFEGEIPIGGGLGG